MAVEVLSESDSGTLRVEVLIDTGFTGHLTLPPASVDALSLQIVGSAESVLADGSLVLEDLYTARVQWHGEERPVRILVAEATPLLGMALLSGSELRVRVEERGYVLVEKLSG